jgi:hypothetical protein
MLRYLMVSWEWEIVILACSTIRLKGTSQSFFDLSRAHRGQEFRFWEARLWFELDFVARTCTILATTMKEEAPLILLLGVLPVFRCLSRPN